MVKIQNGIYLVNIMNSFGDTIWSIRYTRPMAAHKIVFANQKGGVGKTTTAVNLGAYLAESGKRVLLIDFDPQGNLSSSVAAEPQHAGIYELITGKASAQESVQKTPVDNMSVISSNIDLTGASIELIDADEREFYLKRALEPFSSVYDFICIDCPPSLGILTLNGLVAATSVVIPLQCEYFALEGLSMLIRTIKGVQKKLHPSLDILGILFTMYDSRTRLANEVVRDVSQYFSGRVFKSIIPRNIRLSEAPSFGIPINLFDPKCHGAAAYKSLAEEVLSRV